MFHRDPEMFGPGGRRGPGFGPGFGGFGPGFRAGRGMVEPAILGVLGEKPMHGYEIISTLEEKSHGMWRPSAGSIYPTLQLLEEKGLIKSQEVEGKKVYELTAEGQKEKEQHAERHSSIWEDRTFHLKEMRHFHDQVGMIMMDMRTIARKGSDEQKKALGEALTAFRNRLTDITEGI
jgi:DNA-binding PadR family transcriptional regulator